MTNVWLAGVATHRPSETRGIPLTSAPPPAPGFHATCVLSASARATVAACPRAHVTHGGPWREAAPGNELLPSEATGPL